MKKEKIEKVYKTSKIIYWIIGAIGMVISTIILTIFFWPRSTKKINSICDCPEELYTVPEDDDEEEEIEEL